MSPTVAILLVGIMVAVAILAGFVIMSRRDAGPGGGGVGGGSAASTPGKPARQTIKISEGQKVTREEMPAAPPPSRPIDDPARIKETLQKGKTYSVLLKAGFDARVEDKDYGVVQVVSLAYAAEQQIDRLIEENDGHRVVELRHFVRSRNAKLLCNVEDVRISLGAPGQYLLGMLDSVLPGTTGVVDTVQPIAESILSYGTDAAVRDAASKAVAYVDTLAGKKVRITYEDGLGVTGIEPVGCTLDGDEMDYISATAVLSDCYIWDLKKAPGETWSVDAAQLAPLIDPTLRGIASGEVRFIRDPDSDEGGRRQATLRIESGSVQVNASDDANRRISGFSPRGVLRYGLDSKVVEFAKLLGDLSIEEVSTDHILFESSFKTQPKLSVEYTCTVR